MKMMQEYLKNFGYLRPVLCRLGSVLLPHRLAPFYRCLGVTLNYENTLLDTILGPWVQNYLAVKHLKYSILAENNLFVQEIIKIRFFQRTNVLVCSP